MVPSRGTCTLLASYRGRGYEARGVGVQNGGLQERACNLCVLEPTPGQKPHRPALGTRGSAGPCLATSCCHPPRPRASPATPRAHGILVFLSAGAVWTWAGKRPCPTPPPSTPRADPAGGSQTTGQRQRLPRRHFLRNSQVPAPSASAACGLPLYFSPNRLPGCHGMSGCSGIGREFRIWRRPCWSLWAWSAQLL